MADRESGSSGRSADARDVVELRLPADAAYLSVLRTATAGLAARLDFTLDEIEDLRIAVDEACAMLLPDVVPGEPLDLRVHPRRRRPGRRPSQPASTADHRPEQDTFAWTVLDRAGRLGRVRDPATAAPTCACASDAAGGSA